MKNITKFLMPLLIVFLSISLLSCGKKDESKSASDSTSVSVTAPDNLEKIDMGGEAVALRYKFEKGDKLKYRLTTITEGDQSIQADSLIKTVSNQKISYIFDLNVLDKDKDNNYEIEMNISSINMNTEVNGQKIAYDSKNTYGKEDRMKYLEYETIVKTPYRVRMNEKGEIIEVTRLDKMVDNMIAIQDIQQKPTVEEKAQAAKGISESAIRPLSQLVFRTLPDNKMGKDSSWVQSYPTNIGAFQMTNKVTYTVDDFVKADGDKAAKISASLGVTWTGKNAGTENGVNYKFDDPKISGSGFILFDIDNGLLKHSETATSVNMRVQLDAKDSQQKVKKTVRHDISKNRNIVDLIK